MKRRIGKERARRMRGKEAKGGGESEFVMKELKVRLGSVLSAYSLVAREQSAFCEEIKDR